MLIFIAFWAVILLVVPYLCLFSLILQGLFEEGEFRQLEFWTGKGANPSPLFYTSPNALKIYVDFFWNILKILGERTTGGGPPGPHKLAHRHHPPGGAGQACGLPEGPLAPLFWYMKRPGLEKNQGGAFLWFRRRHEAELEQIQSRALAGRSCHGTSLPEGEIVAIVIINLLPSPIP